MFNDGVEHDIDARVHGFRLGVGVLHFKPRIEAHTHPYFHWSIWEVKRILVSALLIIYRSSGCFEEDERTHGRKCYWRCTSRKTVFYDNFVSFWTSHSKHLHQLGRVIPNIHVTLDIFLLH